MKVFLRFSTLIFCLAYYPAIFSQNILITYQKSDALFVCGTDTFFVQVKNTGLVPVIAASLKVTLPTGVQYQSGTILGAIEQNISNLGAPVFGLINLPVGATVSTALILSADCAAADAIDAGQLFVADLQVASLQGNAQILTSSFPVETGLLLIDSVDHVLLSGTRDDTLFRKIWVRNTRLGKIGALHFEDAHQPGLEVALPAATVQTNGLSFTEAEFDGSFFTAFGDGDAWLELGETACFTERIVITDCGIPAFTNPSLLRVGWGCGGDICRYDSVLVSTTIGTSTKLPDLKFTTLWAPPMDNCGKVTSTMRIKIKNAGGAAAKDLLINLKAVNVLYYGMDAGSFRLARDGDTTYLAPSLAIPFVLPSCGKTFAAAATLVIPKIAAQDSVDLLFDTYYCVGSCTEVLGTFVADYFYRKRCPPDGFVSDTLVLEADSDYLISPSTSFGIGGCLQDGGTYTVLHKIKSKRLRQTSGILHVDFVLPWGLSFDPACLLLLGGVAPVSSSMSGLPGQPTAVRLSYQLPLPNDSAVLSLCLRYDCRDGMDCTPAPVIVLPTSGGQFNIDVDPAATCPNKACYLPMQIQTYWSLGLNTAPACVIGSCTTLKIAVEPCIPDPGPGGNTGDTLCCDTSSHLPNSKYVWDYLTYRLNFDLPDQNNDRTADGTGSANAPGVRRDRFLPGDTLRVEYRGYVVEGGGYHKFGRVLWNEIVRSDIGGPMQNDAFLIQAGQHKFVNADSFQYVRNLIRVHYADGMEVNCELDDRYYKSDQHYFRLQLINTYPPLVLDELVSQRQIFKADLDSLFIDGCLPKPTLDVGDSIFFYTDYRIRCNLNPKSSNYPNPPLVGFRMALALKDAHFAWNDIPPIKSQYSGYYINHQSNLIGIKPCENSTTIKPYRYRLRIARENMFPFEVRPLVHILDYVQTFPPGLQVESARLLYLALQDSITRLTNLPLSFIPFDSTVHVNFDPVFADPVDEGFVLGATVQFQPDCRFDKADTSHQIITYQTAPGFATPDIYTSDQRNGLGFYANRPHISLLTPDTIVYMPVGDFSVNFTLSNLVAPSAPNLWLAVVSPSGQALDFSLSQVSPPLSLTATNGIFQLNQLNGFIQRNFLLQGLNTACDEDTLLLVFGWGCTPVNDLSQVPCARDTFPIVLRLQSPELELDITQQPAFIPICTESDYFEFEIFNAKTGYAIDPLATVQLPPGLSIVPGTCQLAYPATSGYDLIPDPLILPGNVYQWTLNDLEPLIAAAGLPGVDLDPLNAVRIRFRTLAECGFVSNAQPFFGTSGQSACGRKTNLLNKPGNPLLVNGLNAGYGVTMNLQALDNQGVYCGGTQPFQLTMTLGGTPSVGDSVYLVLPPGTTLVPGSYQAQQNAPNGPPTVFAGGFRLPLPMNAGAGTVIQFQFMLAYAQAFDCNNQNLIAQTRVRSEAFCASLGASCTVYVATGETAINITLQHPELALGAVSFQQLIANGQTTTSVTVNNIGLIPAPDIHAQIWQDVDGDGLLSAADILLQTLNGNQSIAPGGSLQLAGELSFNAAEICHLLVVLPAADNCTCSDRVLAIQHINLQHAVLQNCVIEAITLGVTDQPGASYQWQTMGIVCDTCATTSYQPPADAQPGQTQTVVLEEKLGDCVVLHNFVVLFGAIVSIDLNNAVICAGQTATLTATPAGATYQWQGPTIVNTTIQQQTVQPGATATYTVTALFPGGCTSTASTLVTVLPKDSTLLPPITTCQGVPVAILDKVTAMPGMYILHLLQASGCDSVVLQQLLVLPKKQTAENLSFCTGDTLAVFDTLLTQSGQVCRTYQGLNGCDSVHCITVNKLALPAVATPDTLYGQVGQPIAINGPNGFVQYVWVPSVPGCNNCTVLQVQADSAGLYQYLVTVTDDHGCETTVTYRLLVFPPCDPQRVLIPSAFTPNGDGVNDVFQPIDTEGGEVIASLTIYDRWGEKVYENQGNGNAFWNGTIDGKPAMSDVYVYIIEVACALEKVKRVGEVSVLR